jgi:hypothetical protein
MTDNGPIPAPTSFSDRVVPAAAREKIDLSQLKIIMMDDDPDLREIIPMHLQEKNVGKRIDAVASFEELWLTLMVNRHTDIVLLDKTCFVRKGDEEAGNNLIPGLGMQVAKWFREYKPEVGVVIVSTEITELDRSENGFFYVDKKIITNGGGLDEFIAKLIAAIESAATQEQERLRS